MTAKAAPVLLSSVEVNLPRVTFDRNCGLHSLNQPARDLFGPNGAQEGELFDFLFPQRELDDRPGAASPSGLNGVDRLEQLAAKARDKKWGEGVVLEFVLPDANELGRAEATVTAHSPDTGAVPGGFTLVLLRSLPSLTTRFSKLNSSDPKEEARTTEGWFEHAVTNMAAKEGDDEVSKRAHADPNMNSGQVLSLSELTELINEVHQIVFVSRPDGSVYWINKRWYEFTGLPIDAGISVEGWLETVYRDDLPNLFEQWHKGLRDKAPFSWEYRVKNAQGEWRWLYALGTPMKDDNWAVTITEIHDRVMATEAAERATLEAERVNERMRTVLSSASVLLLCVDLESKLTFSEGSSAVASSLGALLTDSSIGQPLGDVWPDTQLQESARKMLEPDAPANLSFRTDIESATGTKYFQYRLSALMHSSGEGQEPTKQGLIIVGSDITHIIATEAALERSKNEQAQLAARELAAREASKLKDLFMQTLSHEIRTPISTVSSICELLLGDANLSKEQRALVNQALRSSNILLDLVGLVLDLRKVETGALTLEDNPFVIQDVIEDCKLFEVPCKAKGVGFVVDVDPNLWPGHVMGDRLRLRQILTNGIANAVKFTKEGIVSLLVHQTFETVTQVGIEFLIKDEGIGITEDDLAHLFKPFQQANAATAREYGGTGLGLTIARNLAELMGGTVDLESEPGVGTTMIVRVTLAKRPDFKLTDPIDKLDTDIQSHRTPQRVEILLADDNDILRQVYTKTLERMKFNVTTVNDGQEAVDLVKTKPFDLILMDQQMPNLGGLEATRLIRADPNPRVNKIVIIALTAGVIAGNKEACLAAGSNAYLSKPVRSKTLEAAIWEQLELAEQRQVQTAKDKINAGKAKEDDERFSPPRPNQWFEVPAAYPVDRS